LFIVSLFCFAFVLMQPHNQTQAKTAASHSAITPLSNTQPALSQPSQANLPKLSQEPVTASPSPVTTDPTTASNPSSTLSTTVSQAANTGATASLQSAKSNSNQATGNRLKVNLNNLINNLELH